MNGDDAAPSSGTPQTSRIVKLNIGGRRFVTTDRTLLSASCESFFSVLLGGRFEEVLDDEGAYFIDRDGASFEPILTYLRTGQFIVPPGMSLDGIFAEADYYGITPLMELISARRGGGPLFLTKLEPSRAAGIGGRESGSGSGRSGSVGSASCSSSGVIAWQAAAAKAGLGPKRILSVGAVSNIVAAWHHDSTISCWRYEGAAEGWRPLMMCRPCPFVISGLVVRETKNSIEQMKNAFMCAHSVDGAVLIWDRLNDATAAYRTWPEVQLSMQLDYVKFACNSWFLVAVPRDGVACKVVDLRNNCSVEAVPLKTGSSVTCVADADPLLFLGAANGTIWELKQDLVTGAWSADRAYTDPGGDPVTSIHCVALADRQSTKLFLCVGTGRGVVRLCSKTLHSDVSFQILTSVAGHHCEPISQVLVTESIDTAGILFSSLSSGGYARSWHLQLEQQPPVRGDADKAAVSSHVPLHVVVAAPAAHEPPGPPGARQASMPQPRPPSGARCVCTISHLSAALGGSPFSELLRIGGGRGLPEKKDNVKKHQGQLLVVAHPNSSLACYDLNEFLSALSSYGPAPSSSSAGVTVYPIDRAVTTCCCIMSTSMTDMLVTGHANGCLQVWDIHLAIGDNTFRPVDLTIF